MSAAVDKQALIVLAKRVAGNFKLDPALVCSVIEQESNWNPWAMRYEPLFFAKYVANLFTNNKITATEAYARGMSWGLCQVMGQTAREVGFEMTFLSALCDPEAGISIGCAVLARKMDANKGDLVKGLLAWNGGGNPNYVAQVTARMERYK
jgi:soluble lytic murein transglycosylase-like protein